MILGRKLKPQYLDKRCIWQFNRWFTEKTNSQPLELWPEKKLREEWEMLDHRCRLKLVNAYNEILPFMHDHPFYKEIPGRLRGLVVRMNSRNNPLKNRQIIEFIATSPHKVSKSPLYTLRNPDTNKHLEHLTSISDGERRQRGSKGIENLDINTNHGVEEESSEEQTSDSDVEESEGLEDSDDVMSEERENVQSGAKTDSDQPHVVNNPYYVLGLLRGIQRKSTQRLNRVHESLHSLMFGQPLCIDCSYEKMMQGKELRSYIHQLYSLYKANSEATNPFSLHFCNITEDSVLHNPSRHLANDVPPVHKWPIKTTSQCMSQVFNTEDLIMLSPHAPLMMEKFEPDKVYIIGGWVDLTQNLNPDLYTTYKKATELGIKSYKLPLHAYVDWGSSCNTKLVLAYPMNILHHLQQGKNWESAIKLALPKRVLERIEEAEERRRSKQAEIQKFKRDRYLRVFRGPTKYIHDTVNAAVADMEQELSADRGTRRDHTSTEQTEVLDEMRSVNVRMK